MKRALERLYEGDITFSAFVHETRSDWRSLSQHLYGRYITPCGVTRDDVEQEMLMEAWLAIDKWDPHKGMALHKFVVWRAITSARRFINVQRNSPRRCSRAPGRFPRALSGLSDDDHLPEATIGPVQEEALEQQEILSVLLKGCAARADALAFCAIISARGDVQAAANSLWDDPDLRLICRLHEQAEAKVLVRSALRTISKQVGGANGKNNRRRSRAGLQLQPYGSGCVASFA